MKPTIFLLAALIFVSAFLAAFPVIAWRAFARDFGRVRQARRGPPSVLLVIAAITCATAWNLFRAGGVHMLPLATFATADEISIKLGIDAKAFRTALKDANTSVAKLKKEANETALDGFSRSLQGARKTLETFRNAAAGAGVVQLIRSLSDAGVEFASQWRGSFDSAIARTLALKEAQQDLGSIVSNVLGRAGVTLQSWMSDFGVAVGSLIYGVDAASDALTKMDEEARRAFDATKAKELLAAETKLAEVRLQGTSGIEKVNALLAQQAKLIKEQQQLQEGTAAFVLKQADIEKTRIDIQRELTSSVEKAAAEQEKAAAIAKKASEEQLKFLEDEAKAFEEYSKAAADRRKELSLGREADLELFTLQRKNLASLTADERVRLDILKLQASEQKTKVELENLHGKLLEGTITPAEKDRLESLIKQSELIAKQIEDKKRLATAASEQVPAEQKVGVEINGQTIKVGQLIDEKTRLALVTAGAELNGEKAVTAEIIEQVKAKAELKRISGTITNTGDIGGLNTDSLRELLAKLNRTLSGELALTLTQRQDTVIEASLKAQIAAIQKELDTRKDFARALDFLGSGKTEVKFGSSEFSRLSGLISPDVVKAGANAQVKILDILSKVFPDAARNVR